MPTYIELAKSTFMDFVSYRSNASGEPTGGHPLDVSTKINVALVLDRANDPTTSVGRHRPAASAASHWIDGRACFAVYAASVRCGIAALPLRASVERN